MKEKPSCPKTQNNRNKPIRDRKIIHNLYYLYLEQIPTEKIVTNLSGIKK